MAAVTVNFFIDDQSFCFLYTFTKYTCSLFFNNVFFCLITTVTTVTVFFSKFLGEPGKYVIFEKKGFLTNKSDFVQYYLDTKP